MDELLSSPHELHPALDGEAESHFVGLLKQGMLTDRGKVLANGISSLSSEVPNSVFLPLRSHHIPFPGIAGSSRLVILDLFAATLSE